MLQLSDEKVQETINNAIVESNANKAEILRLQERNKELDHVVATIEYLKREMAKAKTDRPGKENET